MNFNEIRINDEIRKAIVELGYETLTSIQEKSFELITANKDIIGEAPTGTGKTAAYIIPMLEKININSEKIQTLILVPTRELAIQSCIEINKFSKYMKGIRALPIYGGQPIGRQISALKKRPQIIVSTPGRMLDHVDRHTIKLSDIMFLVLDECDEMLNMGFKPDIDSILSNIKTPHQTILFSATISNDIREMSKKYQHDAEFLVSKRDLSVFKSIDQFFVQVKEDDKIEALKRLIMVSKFNKMFVFVRTKRKVDKIFKTLYNEGFSITYIHGDLTQNKRDDAMRSIRNNETHILLATDVAARGLDVNDVDIVVNFDLPEDDEYYVHRIGRTGRANAKGVSYTFVGRNTTKKLLTYEILTNDKIKRYVLPEGKEGQIMSAKNQLVNIKEITQENLKEYKDLINETLASWLEEGTEVDPLTLAAALLRKQVVVEKRSTGESTGEESPRRERSERSSSRPESNGNSQRFFINIGTTDNLDNDGLKHFIVKYFTSITEEDFLDVYLKETYSFFELPKDKIENLIETINDTEFGSRTVHVEYSEAKERRSNSGGSRSFGGRSSGGRSSGGRSSGGRSYEGRSSSGYSGRSSDGNSSRSYDRRPSGDRPSYNNDRPSFGGDRPSFDRGSSAPRSYDRRPSGDRPASTGGYSSSRSSYGTARSTSSRAGESRGNYGGSGRRSSSKSKY
ncbi:MAG: DEAD/DEAH box helicase [Bacilli bacterium]